jgi:hypothetical protein
MMTMLLGCVVVSSLLFAPTTPRRHPGARACVSDAPTSSVPPEEPSGKPSDDSISSVPADMPMEGARSMRIDQRSMDNEQELWDKPVATREEMASVIPDWAAGLMLEGERRDEYESERADEQTRSYRRVDGRDWAEMYGDSDEALTGMGGDSAGMGAFTPVEISEDYNLPPETVLTRMASMGVHVDEELPRRPVNAVCAPEQVTELLHYVAGADAIAEREALIDETLSELASEFGLTCERLEELCEEQRVTLVLGPQTRLRNEDYGALLSAVNLEVARRGTTTRYNNYVNELEKAYMATDDTPSPDDPTPPDEAWREVRDRRRP